MHHTLKDMIDHKSFGVSFRILRTQNTKVELVSEEKETSLIWS